MYNIATRSKKAEKQYYAYLNINISEKLEKLKIDPRR